MPVLESRVLGSDWGQFVCQDSTPGLPPDQGFSRTTRIHAGSLGSVSIEGQLCCSSQPHCAHLGIIQG